MKSICTLLLAMVSLHAYAQKISGKIIDDKNNPISSALVHVQQNGWNKDNVLSDNNGNYTVGVDPGFYILIVLHPDYDTIMTTCFEVKAGITTVKNIVLARHSAIEIKKINKSEDEKKIRLEIKSKSTHEMWSKAGTDKSMNNQVCHALPPPNPYLRDARQKVTLYDPSLPEYKRNPENDFMNVKVSPLSTMSVDVDRASYSNVRQFINAGQKPPCDAVRIEEIINYFDYEYPQPAGEDPIAIQTELTNCPWQEGNKLLHIGMQAVKINTDKLPPSNLVFLIDVSGSMDAP